MARRRRTKRIRRRATNVATFNKVLSPCSTSTLQEWIVLLQRRQYLGSPWGYRDVPYLFGILRTSSSYVILWPVVAGRSVFVVERQTWRRLTKYFLLVQRRHCRSELYCFDVPYLLWYLRCCTTTRIRRKGTNVLSNTCIIWRFLFSTCFLLVFHLFSTWFPLDFYLCSLCFWYFMVRHRTTKGIRCRATNV